jgi:hypothetical protein
MQPIKQQAGLALIGAVAIAGCSSNYQPAKSPRISVTLDGGVATYYKDGKEYPAGFFGGGLIDAVRGNPRAEAEASKGRDLIVAGFVVSMVGVGGLGSGIALMATDQEGPGGTQSRVGVGLFLGGFAAQIASIVLDLNAAPHFHDAVNIYNDDLERPVAPQGSAPVSLPSSAPAR